MTSAATPPRGQLPSPSPATVQRLAAHGLAQRGGAVLLVRSSVRSGFPGWWSLPGGGVDHGEHPLETVVREFREETGLIVRVSGTPQLYSNLVQLPGGTVQHSVRIVVAVDVVGGALADEPDGTTDMVRWVAEDGIASLHLMPFTREALDLPPPEKPGRS